MSHSGNNILVITPQLIGGDESVRAYFTLKSKGFNAINNAVEGLNLGTNTADSIAVIKKNRRALVQYLGLDENRIAYAGQVHKSHIVIVNKAGVHSDTDGLITTKQNLTLAIQAADCAVILCWDSNAKIIGAFHAGWRGAVAEIVPKGIKKMTAAGANLTALNAFISPCISLTHFEVGREVAVKFPEKFVDRQNYKKSHIDLKGFLEYQIMGEGVKKNNIEIHPGCTFEQAEKFYSYRREGNQSGRMMGLIQLI